MNAAPPPPTKNHIGFFFKSKTPKASFVTVSAETEMKLSSSAAVSSSTITFPTVNAHVAIENRERFLNEKENDMLKKLIMSFLKIFLYKWEIFKVLQDQYEGSQARDNRKSGLKRKLVEIDEALIKIKKPLSSSNKWGYLGRFEPKFPNF